ncbi:MAG: sigma 54-interacting transcriptional regulator [Spirochaetes bacterium]|nr:sigma 54-interacting transcriptional regulator [Spirochaetota bacterium]
MGIKLKDNKDNYEDIVKHYQSITDLIHAGINLIDKNGIIIYVNEAYCKMHNYTKEELIGKSIDVVLPGNNQKEHLERYKKIIYKEVKQHFTVEGINIRKDGSKFPVLISWNYLIKDGELDGMVTVIQDLTKIREVENALKESEKKYRSLVETISDFLWEIDEYGNYTYVSPKCKDIFNYDIKDMMGKKIWDFINENYNDKIEELKQYIYTKKPFSHLELLKKGKKENNLVIVSSGIPIYDKDKFIGFRGIDRDITAQKRVEEINNEINRLKDKLEKREYLVYIMGDSPKIKEVHKAVEKVANTNFSVIIHGETGTGKEIVANAIHNFSSREKKPMISVDCGAIPESLIESELFGCIKGAYTGAVETKDGAFQLANGGTLFLDEVTNLSIEMQKKLLRVLQEREVKKLGSNKTEKLDIRIIAASNENITKLVNEGKFRKDLYFRLNEFCISLPPLRERKEDIPLLTQRFNQEISSQLHIKLKTITKDAIKLLCDYDWPGNVRELKNTLKKAIVISETEIGIEHFDIRNSDITYLKSEESSEDFNINDLNNLDLKKIAGEYSNKIEKEIIKKTLIKFEGNKSKTAKFLNIDYKTLLTKISSYGL